MYIKGCFFMKRQIILMLIGLALIYAVHIMGTKDAKSDMNDVSTSHLNVKITNEPVEPTKEIIEEKKVFKIDSKDIGVVIKNNNYSSIYHKKCIMSSDSDMVIKKDNGEIICKSDYVLIEKSGDYFKVTANDNIHKTIKNVVICPEDSSINIANMERCENTSYEGKFYLYKENKGIVMVNKLDLESYLCGVVSSEMPSGFDLEAQKSQAVCARTYAVKYMVKKNATYEKYKAAVDDSTSYQVYNKQSHNENANKAVNETKGEILTYEGEPAQVYYFSSSSGYTADVEEVFGRESPYIVSAIQTRDAWQSVSVMDISGKVNTIDMNFSEEEYKRFLNERDNFIESESPWFLWNVEMDKDAIVRALRNVGYMDVSGFTGLEIASRGKGGIVNKICIKTKSKDIYIENQYNIRQALAPLFETVYKNDGSKVTGMKILPSAFFTINKTKNGYKITGSGYGHGVGMSQYGANYMSLDGKDYKEILNHYFYGAILCELQ